MISTEHVCFAMGLSIGTCGTAIILTAKTWYDEWYRERCKWTENKKPRS